MRVLASLAAVAVWAGCKPLQQGGTSSTKDSVGYPKAPEVQSASAQAQTSERDAGLDKLRNGSTGPYPGSLHLKPSVGGSFEVDYCAVPHYAQLVVLEYKNDKEFLEVKRWTRAGVDPIKCNDRFIIEGPRELKLFFAYYEFCSDNMCSATSIPVFADESAAPIATTMFLPLVHSGAESGEVIPAQDGQSE